MSVGNLDWAVIQEIPVKNAFSTINNIIARLLLAGLVLVVGVTAINTYFGVKFSNLIKRLEHTVEEISGGNLENKIKIEGNSELSRLAETLDNMRKELRLRRQQEQAVRQAEKLSSLGLMAAGVAHELNNPLAVISAYAEDLQDRFKEESVEALIVDGDVSKYLNTINKQIKRCKQITSSLLNFSRQSGEESSFSNVGELVKGTLGLINYRIKQKDIYTEINIEEPMGPLKGSFQEVQQVLLNVVSNSLDALKTGGRLIFYGRTTQTNFILKVKDNGTGIKTENMERLMDPFFTTKEPGKGTGLGLSISFSIMQRIGGNIELESEYGKGTIVTLTFPVAKEENNAAEDINSR